MTVSASKVTMLKKIAELRQLQLRRADLQLAESGRMLRAAEKDREEAEAQIAERVESWQALYSSVHLPLELAGLFITDIDRRQIALTRLEEEAAQARRTKDAAESAWRVSTAHAGCADRLVDEASHDLAHRREERRLGDNADRFLHGGAR